MEESKLIILIYFLSLAVYGFFEIIVQRKYFKRKSKKTDKGFIFLLLSFYMAIYLTPLEYVLLKQKLMPGMILSGFIILTVGILIRFIGLYQMKYNFSTAIEAGEDNTLVTTGLYRYIRHPLYLAVFMIAAAGSIIFSCIYSWIMVLITLVAIINRIKHEEIFLNQHYQDYAKYSEKTWKLIPFIY